MTFTQAVGTCLHKFVTFSGRAPRAEFWWFFVLNLVVSFGASIVDSSRGYDTFYVGSGLSSNQGPIGSVLALLLLLPNLSVSVRRLHDVGRTGFWILLIVVPCVGFLVLLVFFCSKGQQDANAYGDPARPRDG